MTEWYPTENDEKINDLMIQLREARAEIEMLKKYLPIIMQIEAISNDKEPIWQPIETAPKSKSIWFETPSILGKLPNGDVTRIKYHEISKEPGWFGDFSNGKIKNGCWLKLNESHQPTHWMPLPTPPRRRKK